MAVARFLLLLVVVATGCLAQKKCCFPAQFEVSAETITASAPNGMSDITFDNYKMAVDHTNNRMAEITYKQDLGALTKFQNIYDYKKGIEYMIQVKPIVSSCSTSKLKANMTKCVPSNAKFLGDNYFGDKKFYVDSFQYAFNRTDVSGTLTLGVSRKTCIPASVLLIGEQYNVPKMFVIGISNYTKGISDPDMYFKVPDFCSENANNEEVPKQAGHFSFF